VDLHVFRFNPVPSTDFFQRLLSNDEVLRADRYKSEVSYRQYVQSRAVLRSVLSKLVSLPAREVPLQISSTGKPYLAESRIEFSLSHSEDIGVLAIAVDTPVVVDLEKIRDLPEALSISEQHFAPGEMESDEAFFRCWTRKEAYLKGLGEGLARPLDTFRIDRGEQSDEIFVPVIDSQLRHAAWFVRSFTPCKGYAGAIAANGNDFELRQFLCVPVESLLCQEVTVCA